MSLAAAYGGGVSLADSSGGLRAFVASHVDECAVLTPELLDAAWEAMMARPDPHRGLVSFSTVGQPDDGSWRRVDRCGCGRLILDGPFRFCSGCRQVDLTMTSRGGS